MNLTKQILSAIVLSGSLAISAPAFAADQKPSAAAVKGKPYPLKTCLVSDEKLGGMGDPYVFVHEGQEVKLCCKSCLKKFNKEPQKYMEKLKKEAAKDAKAAPGAKDATAGSGAHAGHAH